MYLGQLHNYTSNIDIIVITVQTRDLELMKSLITDFVRSFINFYLYTMMLFSQQRKQVLPFRKPATLITNGSAHGLLLLLFSRVHYITLPILFVYFLGRSSESFQMVRLDVDVFRSSSVCQCRFNAPRVS